MGTPNTTNGGRLASFKQKADYIAGTECAKKVGGLEYITVFFLKKTLDEKMKTLETE